jgi:mitochondrial fission protein ELM1
MLGQMPETSAPLIWVLISNKQGDNMQVLRAAEAMRLPFKTYRLLMKPEFEKAKPKVEASLHHIDLEKSDRLSAPWPDLVITIGRRLSMAALWIKQQSGGKSRLALFNAPKGKADQFDLIIAPAYYKLADSAKLLRIGLPLLGVDDESLSKARAAIPADITAMPRPLTVILLGGSTSLMRLDAEVAREIVTKAIDTGNGGSLFVSTSRRTSTDVAPAVAAMLRPQDRLYQWSPGDTSNPYFSLLASGDRFVVTGDSISMIIEIAKLGKPLAVAELPAENMHVLRVLQNLGWKRPTGSLARSLLLLGTEGQTRDFRGLHRYLIGNGLAVPLGEKFREPDQSLDDDTAKVAQALRRLASSAADH